MSFIRKNPGLVLLVVGSIMVAQSILWEYVRMHPNYRFLVEPWSIRGFDTPQGKAIAALGVGLLLLSVAVYRGFLGDKKWQGLAIGGGAWAAAVAIAAISAPDPVDVTLNSLAGLALSMGIALITVKVVLAIANDRVEPLALKSVQYGMLLVTLLVVHLAIVSPLLVGEQRQLNLAIVVAILFGGPTILAIALPPTDLAINRVLINSAVGAWIVVGTSGGALRSTLLRLQVEELGVSAQFKDAQVTSGVIVAWFGCALVFLGAVALWARRRDHLSAQKRAAQQRAAAAESVAEMDAVL